MKQLRCKTGLNLGNGGWHVVLVNWDLLRGIVKSYELQHQKPGTKWERQLERTCVEPFKSSERSWLWPQTSEILIYREHHGEVLQWEMLKKPPVVRKWPRLAVPWVSRFDRNTHIATWICFKGSQKNASWFPVCKWVTEKKKNRNHWLSKPSVSTVGLFPPIHGEALHGFLTSSVGVSCLNSPIPLFAGELHHQISSLSMVKNHQIWVKFRQWNSQIFHDFPRCSHVSRS